MNFQEELKQNLRPKEDATKEKAAMEYNKIMETAQAELSAIKKRLIENAQKGEYTIENGVTTVSCLHAIPHSFLRREYKSNNEELRRNAKRPVLFQDTRLQYRTWWVLDISSKHRDEYNRYMAALEAVAAKEKIKLECVVHFVKNNRVYKLPAIVSSMDFDASNYLCVRASTVIASESTSEKRTASAPVDQGATAQKDESEDAEQTAANGKKSDSSVILKSLIVIGLCVGAFAITFSEGVHPLFGGVALIGAAVVGYSILSK